MNSEILIKVEGVSKKFCKDLKTSLKYGVYDLTREVFGRKHEDNLRTKEFWAVKDVSFELKRGEVLGLIGKNGAGKTTLLKLLNGLIKPDSGMIEIRGRIGALISLGAGFNPILTGRENVYVNGSVLGLTKNEIKAKFDEIVDFAEIGDFIDAPVQSYSSGMNVRLGFAIASSLDPDILLIDEVLAVGDVGFRTKCYNRIYEVCKTAAVIFVSHSMSQIDRLCKRAIVLTGGKDIFQGDTGPAIDEYNRLFISQFKEWQITHDVKIFSINVNGESNKKVYEINGFDSMNVEICAEFPKRVKNLEVSLSVLEKSFDLISQANSRFFNNNISNEKPWSVIRANIFGLNIGSGTKLLSISVVDADTNEILLWAHGGWELKVTHKVYVPSPSIMIANFNAE